MKSTTPAPSVSIPQGVYDLETLKTECDALVLQPTRPNIRRVRRALAIVDTPNAISNLANFDDGMKLYSVQSQSHPDSSYIVRSHGTYECTRPDYGKGNICKHSMAVQMHEERLTDQAKYDEWLCEQYETEKASELTPCHYYDPIDFPID